MQGVKRTRIREPILALILCFGLAACSGPSERRRSTDYTTRPQESWRDYEDASNDYAPWLGMMAPAASVRVPIDGEASQSADYGLIWTLPFIIKAGDHRHSGALAVAHYLVSNLRVNRLLYRIRFKTWRQEHPRIHLFGGAGAYIDNYGGGPLGELALLIGRIDRAGLMLSSTWSYSSIDQIHVLQFSAGTWIPYVW